MVMKCLYQALETIKFPECAFIQRDACRFRILYDIPQTFSGFNGSVDEFPHCCLPYAPHRKINHSSQRFVIIWIYRKSEIADRVLDLLPLIE